MTLDPAGLKDLFYSTLKGIGELPKLEPTAVANLLGRQVELASENDATIERVLVGGAALPLTRVVLRTGKVMNRTALEAGVVPGLKATMREVLHRWPDVLFVFQVADPEDSKRIGALATRSAGGEIRFDIHVPTDEIRSVHIFDYTVVNWSLVRPWPRSKIPPPTP